MNDFYSLLLTQIIKINHTEKVIDLKEEKFNSLFAYEIDGFYIQYRSIIINLINQETKEGIALLKSKKFN